MEDAAKTVPASHAGCQRGTPEPQDALLAHVPHYIPTGQLGRGSFGVVLRALDTRVEPQGEEIRNYKTYVKREIIHQSLLRHPSIIRLREVFLTPTHLGVVMECANGGDLHSYISRRAERRLSEGEARWFFQQIVVGLDYCHSRGVANRDLKLENLLLDSLDSPQPVLKMCDFGYSKHELNSVPKTSVGTMCYMAPEVYLGYTSYDAKVADIWSLGIILFAMLFGAFPFKGRDRRYIQAVLLGQYAIPPNIPVSQEVMHLLSIMLVPEPTCRCNLATTAPVPRFLRDLPEGVFEMNPKLLSQHVQLADAHYMVDKVVEVAQMVGSADEAALSVQL
ncbi:hypothetical protein QBZ16_005285 [Prototheca wickerhamii]|uniref:Protein kinase domain-containing protein n=1 Tax=Prototheca wickerhamii TaxID=3111 RepID=A0AAD9IFZ9_PROWI|nr:hypothetical protein QBZ16_005285 [Prototheca wickerhamii]